MGFIQSAFICLVSVIGLSHALKSCYVGEANISGSLQDLTPSALSNLTTYFNATPGNYTVCISFSLTRNETTGNRSKVTTNIVLDGSTTGNQAQCIEFAQSQNLSFALNSGANSSTTITPAFKCCNNTDNCNKQDLLGSLSSSSTTRTAPSFVLGFAIGICGLIALISL